MTAKGNTASGKRKACRAVKVIIALAASLLVVAAAFALYIRMLTREHPPAVETATPMPQRLQTSVNSWTVGANWLRKSSRGLWECYLEGEPYERGLAYGMLTKELMSYQEAAFVEQIREMVPSEATLKRLRYFLAWFNRNLEENVTEEYRQEIYGTSLSADTSFNFIGTPYQRQLNYHAAHDIGHALSNLYLTGCTSFSVWNGRSADSSLLVGRNFDFYMGDRFAENKIVCFVSPSEGHRFMMVTWAGMIGVVSGMNERGLTVTLNAAKSEIPLQSATPVSLLAREILQYAGNIGEAVDIASRRKLFVSESIMVGSAADGRTVIIEKSPNKTDVVEGHGDQITCSNHFQGEAFAHDRRNLRNIEGSDSRERLMRMDELVGGYDRIGVQEAAEVLRNREGLGGKDIGMGNPLAINQLIAHHSVIFKPAALLAWVSTSPWQLGSYKAYDLLSVFRGAPHAGNDSHTAEIREIADTSLTIPADPFIQSPAYAGYMSYLEMTRQLEHAVSVGEELPPAFEENYLKTNPSLYTCYVNLGSYYESRRDYAKAASFYNMALTREVAGKDRRAQLESRIQHVNNKIRKNDPGN